MYYDLFPESDDEALGIVYQILEIRENKMSVSSCDNSIEIEDFPITE